MTNSGYYFNHHVHSNMSFLDGMTAVPRLVGKMAKEGYPVAVLTDHGNMAGGVKLYKEAKRLGLEPLLGVEGYLIDPAFDGTLESSGKARRFHFILHALDLKGYHALVRFVSMTHTRPRFSRFPRCTLADLAALGKEAGPHLSLTTGCFFGYVQQTILREGDRKAERIVKMFSQWFPHTFVELQHHNIDHIEDIPDDVMALTDDDMVDSLVGIADRLGLPVLAGQDSHYCTQPEKRAHELMKRMVYGGVEDEFPGDSFHLASGDWVAEHYDEGTWDQILEGHDHLASLAELSIPPLDKFHTHVPDIAPKPLNRLRRLCREFLTDYYVQQKIGPAKRKVYEDRLTEELRVIKIVDMANYFLYMLQAVEWCRRKKFAIEARGSANGSLVVFAIGLTQVDPIKWGTMFERFLAEDRIGPPDVDMDIEHSARPFVLKFLSQDRETVQIGNFCLAPETKVLCADMVWRPLRTLNKGDEVIGFDEQLDGYSVGQQSCYRTATVTSNDKTHLKSFEIVTDTGTVTASSAHKWVVVRFNGAGTRSVRREWVRTDELQPGDKILSVGEPWEQRLDYEAGWVSGFMDGEGHIDSGGRVTVGQVIGPTAEKFDKLVTSHGFTVTSAEPKGHKDRGYQPFVVMRIGGGIHEAMRVLGTYRPERLMTNAGRLWEGRRTYGKVRMPLATVESVTSVGVKTLYAIGTSTGTLIAEGMFTHNSDLGARAADEKGSVMATYVQYLRRKCMNEAWTKEQRRAEREGRKPNKGNAERDGAIRFRTDFGWVESLSDVRKLSEDDWIGLKQIVAMGSVKKSYGVHASGVLISGSDFSYKDWVPTMLVASSNTTVTQYDMHDVEEFGMLKGDWLGQRTLTVMKRCQELMGRSKPTDFTWIPMDDKDACEEMRSGRTDTGVFHQEGYTKAKGGREMGIRSTKDCVAWQALYMPGAMESGQKDLYIERRKGRKDHITYLHPVFENALKDTYGAVIYQEQTLAILRGLGMDPLSVNKMFKVIKDSGKGAVARNMERIKEFREQFDNLCLAAGMKDRELDEAWRLTTGFVSYGFNKAHATGYGIRAYRCAYLKRHYPLEFMSALLEVWAGEKKEAIYVREARHIGIRILPPSVNVSGATWTMDKQAGAIRRGLVSIAGIGAAAANEITRHAPYKDVTELAKSCNPKAVPGGRAWIEEGKLIGALRKLEDVGAMDDLLHTAPQSSSTPTRRIKKNVSSLAPRRSVSRSRNA